MTQPTKAIQSLDIISTIGDEDLVLVVDKKGKVWLAPKKDLHGKDWKDATTSWSWLKKYSSIEEANTAEKEEYDVAVIAGVLHIFKNSAWEQVVQNWAPISIQPANETKAGVVRIATAEEVRNLSEQDGDTYLVPKMSELMQSFIGSRLIAGNTLAEGSPVYIHKAPSYDSCLKELIFGKDEATKYINVQTLANGEPFQEFSVKLKKFTLPTTDIIVDIYKGDETESYFGPTGEKIATARMSWRNITNEGKYVFHCDKKINEKAGTPLVFKFQMQEGIVNNVNYYAIFADENNVSDLFCSAYKDTQNTNGVYLESVGLEKQVIKRTLNGTYKFGNKFKKKWLWSWEFFHQNLAFPEVDPNSPITAKVKVYFHTDYEYQTDVGSGATIPGQISVRGEYWTVESYRTHKLEFTKQITYEQLKQFKIRRIIENHHSYLVNPITEVEYTVELTFNEVNNAIVAQPLHIRNYAKRFKPVVCTVLGLHSDGTFIYPKADGADLVMKGIQGPRWERIQLGVSEKTIQYRYEGEENRRSIGDFTDFFWPPWPIWPQGERGRMWGINYRGQKESLSELPSQASIEWEAYSIWDDLYIRDGGQFTRAGVLSNMNIFADIEQVGFTEIHDCKYNRLGLLSEFMSGEEKYILEYYQWKLKRVKKWENQTYTLNYDSRGRLTSILPS